MAANLPVAFAALLAGGLLLHKGTLAAQEAFGAAPAAAATGASSVPPDAKSIRSYLEAHGFSKTAAAGVVGNLQQESGLDPAAAGGGLAQWQAPRGPARWDLDSQLAYLVDDVKTNYRQLLEQMNAAGSPGEAAVMFQNVYERPGIPAQINRVRYANAAYAL